MFLRDFYLEADRDEIGRLRAQQFNLIARPVVVLYRECFESRNVYDSWRFAVFATADRQQHRELVVPADVATVMWYVDFSAFFARSGTEKRKAALHILHKGVTEIARQKRLSLAPFETAHRRVRALDLCGERECLRLRGTHGLTAIVRGRYEIDQFVAELVVQNRHGFVIGRKLAFRAKSDEAFFRFKLGSLKWESATKVSLFSEEHQVVAQLQF